MIADPDAELVSERRRNLRPRRRLGGHISGSYTEVEEEEPQPASSETYSGYTQEASRTSGSYTEPAEPDFSGEGRPAFGADVEFETGNRDDEDSPERPRSPY